ncbi:MAG: hypothetical protein C4291_05780 [Candidatus Dadabacteria bacterium]
MMRSLNKVIEISPNHQRVIIVGLYMLEKSLERIEEALITDNRERITYKLDDHLDDEVRNSILQDIEEMRRIIRELKGGLNLQTQEESVVRKVRGEAAHIGEALSDMRSSGLDRYGKAPKELADF